LRDRVKEPNHLTRLITNRAQGEGEPGFLEVAVAIEEHRLVLQKRRLTGACCIECAADRRPRGRPALPVIAAKHARMLLAADTRISLIPDLDVARPPDHVDRKGG